VLVGIGASGCCVYVEAPTRQAFRELSEDAGDAIAAQQRCLEDPQANAVVCAQVEATLQDIAEQALEQSKIGEKGETP